MSATHNSNDHFSLEAMSAATQELVHRAAKKQQQAVGEWAEHALKQAAHLTLHPETAQDLTTIVVALQRIEDRLIKLEHNPLHDGARVLSESAKAISESARDIYEKVEARKWFDKSYEAAVKVCDTVSEQFKIWWEARTDKTTSTDKADKADKKPETKDRP